jgi:hypothetical protein
MFERRHRNRIAAACTAAVALGLSGAAGGAVKPNHETDASLGPKANPGEFLGYPSPTYQWHGCKLTAIKRFPGLALVPGEPNDGRGNRPGAVTFTTSATKAPFVRWKTRPGYRVCGVQITAELDNPTVESLLLASAGYTSFVRSGSTSTASGGRESIRVRIAKNDINRESFATYEGKTYAIGQIHDVIVFVKKG